MPPITPAEAIRQKTNGIPEFVFEVVNGLIAEKLVGTRATIYQDDILDFLKSLGYDRVVVFANRWLDIEPAYREMGWAVEYDRPAYNETGKAHFIFTATVGTVHRDESL